MHVVGGSHQGHRALPIEGVKTRKPTATPGLPCSPVWGHGSPQGLGGGQAVLQDPPTPRPWQVLISWPRTPWSYQHLGVNTIPAEKGWDELCSDGRNSSSFTSTRRSHCPLQELFQTSVCPGDSLVAPWLRLCLPMQGMWVRSLVGELRSPMLGVTKPMQHCNFWAHQL